MDLKKLHQNKLITWLHFFMNCMKYFIYIMKVDVFKINMPMELLTNIILKQISQRDMEFSHTWNLTGKYFSKNSTVLLCSCRFLLQKTEEMVMVYKVDLWSRARPDFWFICTDQKGRKWSQNKINKLTENSGLEEPCIIAFHPSSQCENNHKLNGIRSTTLESSWTWNKLITSVHEIKFCKLPKHEVASGIWHGTLQFAECVWKLEKIASSLPCLD